MAAWGRCKHCARWFHLGEHSVAGTAGCPSCGSGEVCVHQAIRVWDIDLDDCCEAVFRSA